MYHSSSHRQTAVKLDIRDFYENLPRKSKFCSITQKYQTLYMKTYICLVLAAIFHCHKSTLFKWTGIRLLGLPTRHNKYYTNTPQCYVVHTLPIFSHHNPPVCLPPLTVQTYVTNSATSALNPPHFQFYQSSVQIHFLTGTPNMGITLYHLFETLHKGKVVQLDGWWKYLPHKLVLEIFKCFHRHYVHSKLIKI